MIKFPETVTKYLSEKTKRGFYAKKKRFKFKKQALEITVVNNGIISVNQKSGAYGVFDNFGKFVKKSKCYWGGNCQILSGLTKKHTDYIDETAVFLGRGCGHFGDGLLNSTPRMWAALSTKYKNAKYVFVSNKGDALPNFYRILLHGLGIEDKNILVLQNPTKFRKIILPDQAFNVWYWSSTEFGKMYRKISDYYSKRVHTPVYDKIYVSRGAMPIRRPFGEQQLENIFKKNGFKIIYPETFPLEKQIALMSHCKVLAGAAGTALHLSLFMKPGGTVIWLKRNANPKNDNAGLQHMLCQTNGITLFLIEGSIEQKMTGHCTHCPQILGITEYCRTFLDDNGYKYTDKDIRFDEVEWSKYSAARSEYELAHGNEISIKIRRKFIKITACFIPGRLNRQKYRSWMKEILL